jgi:hypothetical protein
LQPGQTRTQAGLDHQIAQNRALVTSKKHSSGCVVSDHSAVVLQVFSAAAVVDTSVSDICVPGLRPSEPEKHKSGSASHHTQHNNQ